MTIKELVKNNRVRFDSYRQGLFYYNLFVDTGKEESVNPPNTRTIYTHKIYDKYQFTVPADDIGTATLLAEDKALTFMRWIRKALEDNTLTKLK